MSEHQIDDILLGLLLIAIMFIVIGVFDIKSEHKTNSIDTNNLENRIERLEKIIVKEKM